MVRNLAILSLLWIFPVLTVNTLLVDLSASAFAEEAKPKPKRKKSRRVPAMRETTYKSISEAQVMIDPESVIREEGEPAPKPKGTPQDAVELLLSMMNRRGLNSYERAQIWNTLAFAYYTLNDVPKTIDAYQNILTQGAISEALELGSLRTLAQLYYGEEEYGKAIEYIDKWQKLKEVPDPGMTYLKAYAYYQLGNAQKAFEFALLVEEIAVSQQRTIKEGWWSLQLGLYRERNDSDNMILVLEKLARHYSKKTYWLQLAAMYGEKNWEDKALSAHYAAYALGYLEKESELVILAQRLINSDNPYEGSQVLKAGLKKEYIEENEANYKLLAQAYTLAQETGLAIDAWHDVTRYAEDGEAHYRLAQVLASEDRHKEAIKAYQDALKKGDLDNPADLNFYMGVSQMQRESWDAATQSFREAARLDKEKEKRSRQYIRYVDGQRRRQEELKKMLEDS